MAHSFTLEASLLSLLPLNVDGADIGGSYSSEAEVAPPPLPLEHHPGVELEQALDVPEDGRGHAQQLTTDTCPGAHVPRDRRVKPVIVPRMEIDDHLVSMRFSRREKFISIHVDQNNYFSLLLILLA